MILEAESYRKIADKRMRAKRSSVLLEDECLAMKKKCEKNRLKISKKLKTDLIKKCDDTLIQH